VSDIVGGSMSPKNLKKGILRDHIAFQLMRFKFSVKTEGPGAGLINADSFADAVIETCGPIFRRDLEFILEDLIAELRDDAQHARLFGGDVMSTPRVLARLDRAEQRLREIQGE